MKKKLSNEIRDYFAEQGAKGGNKRAERLTAERRRQIAKKAGETRSKSLTAKQRQQIAKKAAALRWGKGAK